MNEFTSNYNLITKCVLLFFCVVLLSGSSGNSVNPKISQPHTSRDGHQSWLKNYRLEGYYETHGTVIWGEGENIYTFGYALDPPYRDLVVVKWDSSGEIIWEYAKDATFSHNSTIGYDIWIDEEFLYICGTTDDGHPDSEQYLIVKLDKREGNEIWSKQWGVPNFNVNLQKIEGDDSGIYVFGETYTTEYTTEYTLVKFDKDGSLLWNNTWLDNGNSYYLELMGDTSNLYVCVYSWDDISEKHILNTIKWDMEGIMLWNRTSMSSDTQFAYRSILNCDSIYLIGEIQSENKTDGYFGKMDKEAVILWNRSIEITNRTYPMGLGCNEKEVFVCGIAESGVWPFDDYDSFFLGRWDKNGNLNSMFIGANVSRYEGDIVTYHELWANEKDLYLCGSTPMGMGMILAKWDVSKNYFLRIGIPVFAMGLSVIVSWMIFKPVYRIKKNRLRQKLTQIADDLKIGDNYEEYYYNLEKMLNEVDGIKDRSMKDKWHELHNISEVNRDFKKEVTLLKKQVQEGKLDSAHSGLMYLLKKSHDIKYVSILDKRIESEITESLKQVTEEIKKRE